MKLLQEVLRLCAAARRGVAVRGTAGPDALRVTVPASLAGATVGVAADTAPRTVVVSGAPARSEPASFLKAPRHLRQLPGR